MQRIARLVRSAVVPVAVAVLVLVGLIPTVLAGGDILDSSSPPSAWPAGSGAVALLLAMVVLFFTRRRPEPLLAEMRTLRPID